MESIPRGKPVTVRVALDDPLAEATLRTLAFVEGSTMRVQARSLLEAALRRCREQSPEVAAAAQLLVDKWNAARDGVQTHEGKGGLRVVD